MTEESNPYRSPISPLPSQHRGRGRRSRLGIALGLTCTILAIGGLIYSGVCFVAFVGFGVAELGRRFITELGTSGLMVLALPTISGASSLALLDAGRASWMGRWRRGAVATILCLILAVGFFLLLVVVSGNSIL